MATAKKHMERSHRSYHNAKPFADFERKAKIKQTKKENKKNFMGIFKSLFHRTTNK